jgi:hypothetical protein
MGFWFPCRDLIVIRFYRAFGVEKDLQNVTTFTESVARWQVALRTLWLDIEISVNNLKRRVFPSTRRVTRLGSSHESTSADRRMHEWQTKVIKGKQ